MNGNSSFIRRIDQSGIPLLLIRLIVGGLFIYMGAKKVGEPVAFLKLIHMYPMLENSPPWILNTTAVVLPWVEIVCGLSLILGIFLRGSAAVIIAMLCAFTPLVFWRAWGEHLATGKPFMQIAFDCGCGTGMRIIWHKLVENGILLVLAIGILLSGSRRFCLERLLDGRRAKSLYCRLCGYALRRDRDCPCHLNRGRSTFTPQPA